MGKYYPTRQIKALKTVTRLANSTLKNTSSRNPRLHKAFNVESEVLSLNIILSKLSVWVAKVGFSFLSFWGVVLLFFFDRNVEESGLLYDEILAIACQG